MSEQIKAAYPHLLENRPLGAQLATEVMRSIMCGEATPAQIGAFLLGYQMRQAQPDEVAAFVRVMREAGETVDAPEGAIDLCGTGGDGLSTFNISTTAAFVAAAGGALVAKHGNRAASSRSGSVDLLEALGLPVDQEPSEALEALGRDGIAFLFAPRYHPAVKHAMGPRRELGVRTIFNLLGPLANPAGTRRQLMGVFDAEMAPLVAETFRELGSEHVLVVHGSDGMDEITVTGPSMICELCDGEIRRYQVTPEQFGIESASLESLSGGAPAENAVVTERILSGQEAGPRRDVVCLNAGAALYVAGRANSLETGFALAVETIASGSTAQLLERLRR